MIKIAIVEDDPVEADRLKKYIDRFRESDARQISVSHFTNGLDFIEKVNQSFDIVFMDIEMPLMDGLEAAKRFREADESACLIFVTKMAQLAIRGYEVNAMDFLIKPLRYFEFCVKMRKALVYCEQRKREEVLVESKKGIQLLELSEIVYIEVFGHDLVFHTQNKNVQTHGSLKEYEDKFRSKNFVRIAKPYLVNLKHVVSFSRGGVRSF